MARRPRSADDPLTDVQRSCVELLTKGFKQEMIGDALGITPAIIRIWKREPNFKAALAEAINLRAETSNFRLHDLYRDALDEVGGLLKNPNPHIRLGAARLACESYSAIARAAEEKELLQQMEARMEQLQANMANAVSAIETQDADYLTLPPGQEAEPGAQVEPLVDSEPEES